MKRRLATLLALAALAVGAPAASAGLLATGYNASWQLGAGFRSGFQALPVSVIGIPGEVKEVTATDGGTIALLTNGQVVTWGSDIYGQCGCGVRTGVLTAPTPAKFPAGTTITQVSASGSHDMALTSAGTVYVWGSNLFGELGNGTTFHGKEAPGDYSATPLIVHGLTGVRAVVAGGPDDFAILADGTLRDWGENKLGQLGDGTFTERTRPVQARVSGISRFAAGGIGGQGGHAIAILNSGATVAWGSDGQGQLGDGTTKTSPLPVRVKLTEPAASVAASVSHSLAITASGAVAAWGSNVHGELGTTTRQRCMAFPCSSTPLMVPGLSNAAQVSTGFGYSLAASGGEAFGWGWNQYGALGNGTTTDSAHPGRVATLSGVTAVSAGTHHAMFLLSREGPPPIITVAAGPKSLTASWRSAATTERFAVEYRPVTRPLSPFSKYTYLPPSSRSYTITGLRSGQLYEVLVKNATFGTRRVQGTPH